MTSFPRLEVPRAGDLQSRPSNVDPACSSAAEPTAAETPAAGAPTAARGAFLERVTRSVWAMPAMKLLGFCSILACVAWLGERSRDTTIYGPELPKDAALAHPAGAAPAAPAEPALEGGTSAKAPSPAPAPLAPSMAPAPAAPCGAGSGTAQPVGPVPAVPAILPDGRLVLNEASAEELDRLPGIGKKRAEDIVLLRQRLGHFKRIADLLRIRGIGPRSLASLKDHLVLDRPPAPAEAAGTAAQRTGAGPE